MPLETGSYPSDLNASNPTHSDGLNQGDGHLRLIKSVLKTTFPNITGAVTATQAALNAAAGLAAGVIACAANGTTAAPAFTFASEAALGLYRKSAGVLGIAAGNADVVTFSTSAATFTNVPKVGTDTVLTTGNQASLLAEYAEPIGTVKMYVGGSDPSGGLYLLCDGRAISRSTYSVLFALVSTTYGSGNGSTTFNIPNFAERVPVGKASAASLITQYDPTVLGHTFGEGNHALITAELAAHTHSITDPGHAHTFTYDHHDTTSGGQSNVSAINTSGGALGPVTTASAMTGITATNSNGSGTAHNIVQPSLVTNFIIRVL